MPCWIFYSPEIELMLITDADQPLVLSEAF